MSFFLFKLWSLNKKRFKKKKKELMEVDAFFGAHLVMGKCEILMLSLTRFFPFLANCTFFIFAIYYSTL